MKKYYSEIIGVRYPKDPVIIIYDEKIYLNQYIYVELFYEEYVGEQLLSFTVTYDKMNTYYPILQRLEEYDENPTDTILYVILIKHGEIKMVSDGIKISGIEDI